MFWDLCWMSVILLLTVRKALCSVQTVAPKGKEEMSEDIEHAVHLRHSTSDAQTAIQTRLVERLKKQARGNMTVGEPRNV